MSEIFILIEQDYAVCSGPRENIETFLRDSLGYTKKQAEDFVDDALVKHQQGMGEPAWDNLETKLYRVV